MKMAVTSREEGKMRMATVDDYELILLKRKQEHYVCENFPKCSKDGKELPKNVCKNFRNRYWLKISSHIGKGSM